MRTLGPYQVHPIGFGCWGLGGDVEGAPPAYGQTDDRESAQTLSYAIERGINFFDTSGLYGLGRSERLLGAAVRPPALIASKAGYTDASGQQSFEPDYLRSQIVSSAQRLKRESLDLFQLHDPPLGLLNDELFDRLEQWRQQGLFSALGISVRKPSDALEIVGRWPVSSIQMNLSLVDQRAVEQGVLQHCAQHQVGVIARTPLCFGFLARPPALAVGDHRHRWGNKQRDAWSSAPDLFRSSLPSEYPGSDVQLALAYCLSYPEVSLVIPGMLHQAEVAENCATLSLPSITPEQKSALEACYKSHDFIQ